MTSSLFIILQQMLRISILGHKWSYYMFQYLKQFEDSSHAIGMCNSHVLGQLYVDWNRKSLLKWIFKIHQPPHKCTLHVLDTTGKFFIQSKSDYYLLTSIKHISQFPIATNRLISYHKYSEKPFRTCISYEIQSFYLPSHVCN